MFVVLSRYTKEPSEADPHRATHADWVKKYVENGVFLLAGPKISKDGGVIVATGVGREELERILAEDSFLEASVIENSVVEFNPIFAQDVLKEVVA